MVDFTTEIEVQNPNQNPRPQYHRLQLNPNHVRKGFIRIWSNLKRNPRNYVRLIERIVPEDADEKGWKQTERCSKKWSRAPTDLLSLSLYDSGEGKTTRFRRSRSVKEEIESWTVYMGAHFLRKKCYLALSAFSFSFSKWALLLALSTFSFAFF